MSGRPVARVGWLRVAVLWLAVFVLSCASAALPPQAPMRELPKSVGGLLALAPAVYGAPAPVDFGPDDRGSAVARTTFEAMTHGSLVHEPALDLVAAVMGRAYAEGGQSPAYSLIQWIHWKCGAVSLPGPSNVLVVDQGMEAAYGQQMARVVQALPQSVMPLSYGLVRLALPGGSFQAIAIGMRAIDVAPVPKQYAPGATLSLQGTLRAGFTEPLIYVDSDSGDPAEVAVTLSGGNQVTASVRLPLRPGRYFVQLKAADPRRSEQEEPWNRSLFWVPVYVGVGEPALPDDFIRNPPKNYPDRSAWPVQILNAYNAERARLGRSPLAFARESSLIAQASSDERAGLSREPPPDPTIAQRLAEAGLPARDLLHSSAWLEYVAEYTQMRLMEPWVRHRVLGANASVLALGISERRVEPRAGQFSVTEYVFEPVHIDPPKDRERVLGEIEAIEGAAARKAPERDLSLSGEAQRIVDKVCAGGALPKTADEIWQQVGTKAPGLLHRMASVGAGYDVTRESIAALAKPLSEGVSYTRMGAGICQGKVDGRANATYALLLFMGP